MTTVANGQKCASRRSSKGTELSLGLLLVVGMLSWSWTDALTPFALEVEALGRDEATLVSMVIANDSLLAW